MSDTAGKWQVVERSTMLGVRFEVKLKPLKEGETEADRKYIVDYYMKHGKRKQRRTTKAFGSPLEAQRAAAEEISSLMVEPASAAGSCWRSPQLQRPAGPGPTQQLNHSRRHTQTAAVLSAAAEFNWRLPLQQKPVMSLPLQQLQASHGHVHTASALASEPGTLLNRAPLICKHRLAGSAAHSKPRPGRLLGPNTVINKHSPTTAHRPSSIPLTGSHRSAPGASQQQRQPQHFSNHGSFEQNIPQEQFQASQAVVYGASVVQSQPRYAASGTSNQPQAPDSSFVAAAHVNTCLWPQEPSQHYSRMYYESGISSGVEPSSAVQNADQAAAEPTPPMAAAAAAATGPAVQQPRLQTLVGMPVQLGRIYAQDVIPADSCYILEEQLGHGGFAEVFKASLVSSRSSSSIALGAVPCAAVPAAATASAPQAAAKVFRVSSAGISASQFKKYTGRELTALRALIGCQHHVQLLAEGTVQVAHSSNSRGNPAAATVSHVPASPVAAVADTMTLAPAAGSGVSDGEQRVCAVLELLPHTLDNLLSRYGPMPLPLVKKYLRHLLKGVDVLQSGQLPGGIIIVHRDLKAANLFIAADDTLKIADYSCCAILPGPSTAGDPHQHAADRLHSSIGTCCYMAPEVVYKSRDEGYDASVDVWSVGVVAIEMIAGGWSSMLHAAGVGGQLGSKQHEAAWQQQLTTYVSSGYYRGMLSGMWRMPEMQQVRPFLQCCCGPAAQRWKPAELLTHPWLQDPQQQ